MEELKNFNVDDMITSIHREREKARMSGYKEGYKDGVEEGILLERMRIRKEVDKLFKKDKR